MKIHWMDAQWSRSPEEIRSLSRELDRVGYESVLLTFNSASQDNWIKAAAAMLPGQRLKYMIALRPYHLSPQYCAMMIEGFNSIDTNRLIINFVAGDVQNRPEEPDQKDVFGNTENLKTIDDRKKFVRDFVSELFKSEVITSMPEFVFSGYSPYTVKTAEIFDGIGLSMCDDYDRNRELFKPLNRRMVSARTLIRDTDEEAEASVDAIKTRDREKEFTVYGSESTVFKKFLEMRENGVTDILTHSYHNDNESERIHESMNKFINMIKKGDL
jgi:alkanesulfonate monooxygenase SsuD/methylene tetrahydromethanopterin reductase-like flavin-dependent oxidoreductase (luciferase family)